MADELIGRLRDPCVDWTGEQIVDNSTPRHEIECGLLREAATRIETLEREIAVMRERGAKAVIAYHVAICSPKGVVPVDDLYDPAIAAKIERDMDVARQALNRGGAE